MDDKKFKEMAEFEAQNDCTVISPFFARQIEEAKQAEEQIKQKQHFFYVILQDRERKIVDITHYNDYDVALMRGMEKSKETGTYWSIYSLNGKFVDGNFVGK